MDFEKSDGSSKENATNKDDGGMRSVFEFDDEPQAVKDVSGVKMRHKPGRSENTEEEACFVQFPSSPNSNGNGKKWGDLGFQLTNVNF